MPPNRPWQPAPPRRPGSQAIPRLLLPLLAALVASPAAAQSASSADTPSPTLIADLHLTTAGTRLGEPTRLPTPPAALLDPVWTDQGVWTARPQRLLGLASVEKPGIPVYDPSSAAWYASANGTLVRLEPDGRLLVLVDDVQGIDVDVRASAQVAVSREPNDTIVVHRWGGAAAEKTVLRSGAQFFYPRLSPEGDRVLLSESRAEGGRVWVLALDGSVLHVLDGSFPAWHPDGRTVVYARVEHDGQTILASELWVSDVVARQDRLLEATPRPEIEPFFSLDGAHLGFVDAGERAIYVTTYPPATGAD